ncbi:hypothetical protein [Zunongwangia profunda]|uniref:hypothetical protein n=1 Tax=Zunongwangia profunda TaxID=398743 RepID=UPI00059FC9FA|nr:hypothetical protein [Zunongwangia profunda]
MKIKFLIILILMLVGCLVLPAPDFYEYKPIYPIHNKPRLRVHATVGKNQLVDISTSISIILKSDEKKLIENDFMLETNYKDINFSTIHTNPKNYTSMIGIEEIDTLKLFFISTPMRKINKDEFLNLWRKDTLIINFKFGAKTYHYLFMGYQPNK